MSLNGGFIINPKRYHIMVTANDYFIGSMDCAIAIRQINLEDDDNYPDGDYDSYYQSNRIFIPFTKVRVRNDHYILNVSGNTVSIRWFNDGNNTSGTGNNIVNNAHSDRTWPYPYRHIYLIE